MPCILIQDVRERYTIDVTCSVVIRRGNMIRTYFTTLELDEVLEAELYDM
jgi:hypothetical protein